MFPISLSSTFLTFVITVENLLFIDDINLYCFSNITIIKKYAFNFLGKNV